MHVSVSDFDLMAEDAVYLMHNGTAFQPAVDTIAAENKLAHDQRDLLTDFTSRKLNTLVNED